MTVLVTGASGSIGPAVVAAFRRSFPEVRAYVRRRDAAEALRELGAKVAVGEADDSQRARRDGVGRRCLTRHGDRKSVV